MAKDEGKSVKAERDAAAKAVIDNMAKLKAQRLARDAEATGPKSEPAGQSSKTPQA